MRAAEYVRVSTDHQQQPATGGAGDQQHQQKPDPRLRKLVQVPAVAVGVGVKYERRGRDNSYSSAAPLAGATETILAATAVGEGALSQPTRDGIGCYKRSIQTSG